MDEETFKAWKAMPETKEFFKFLEREEHGHRLVVAMGTPLQEETNEQKMNMFIMHLSKANEIARIIDIPYEELEYDDEEDGEVGSFGPSLTDTTRRSRD